VEKASYCKKWSRWEKKPIQPWDAVKAGRAHKNGKLYTVLMGEPQKPTCFLEVRLEVGFVGVSFLDDNLREYLCYNFKNIEDGKMFLTMATHREYVGDSDDVCGATLYYFKPNGEVITEVANLLDNTTKEAKQILDVSRNWEPVPAFGSYEGITRKERIKHS